MLLRSTIIYLLAFGAFATAASPRLLLTPVNATQDALWRPRFHPTGWGTRSAGHVQDPAAPFQDSAGVWHVLPDCWPTTWNAVVDVPPTTPAAGTALGWCHYSSADLVRWTRHPPSVWFDATPDAPNSTAFFHGNCGTGGGALNVNGELVVYCPHGTGVHAFVGKLPSNGTGVSPSDPRWRLALADRAPPGLGCDDPSWSPGCALVKPPAEVLGPKGGTSDPGAPWQSSVDGNWWTVWGSRGAGGARAFAYRESSSAPPGTLRKFDFNTTMFHTPTLPVQRCHAYAGPGRNCSAPPELAGDMECPDTFELGGSQVMLGSLGCGSLGTSSWWRAPGLWTPGTQMAVASAGVLDFGVAYAFKSARASHGEARQARRVLFAWVMEQWCDAGCRYFTGCPSAAAPAVDWDGTLSLPRELRASPEGGLTQRPVREVASLRRTAGAVHWGPTAVTPGDALRLGRGRAVEVNLTVAMPGHGACVGLDVLSSPREATTVLLNGTSGKVAVVLRRSSVGTVGARLPVLASLADIPPAARRNVRVFVDHSVIEVFVDERIVLTARAYPALVESDAVTLWASGAKGEVERVDMWQMEEVA